MPRNHESNQQPPPQKPTQKSNGSNRPKGVGQRYILSSRAQSTLMWILEDIIEKTLEDASTLARKAGKERVELAQVEEALRRLCERYHAKWSSETLLVKNRSGKQQSKRL